MNFLTKLNCGLKNVSCSGSIVFILAVNITSIGNNTIKQQFDSKRIERQNEVRYYAQDNTSIQTNNYEYTNGRCTLDNKNTEADGEV